jgi:membrane associated rhomboid family serine protease
LVFVPLSDDNPLRAIRFQWVTIALIVANVVVFLLENTPQGQAAIAGFALIPSELFQVRGLISTVPDQSVPVPEGLTLITYQFLHSDILHLFSNMLFLWVFGDNVEDAMGHLKFIVFYLACGVAGGLAHAWMLPGSSLPLIGASGAVAGVIAAYLILHPRVRVWVLAFRFIPLRISAAWVLGVWAATQIIMVALAPFDQVAWWAHVGGMAAGGAPPPLLRRAPRSSCSCGAPELPSSTGGLRGSVSSRRSAGAAECLARRAPVERQRHTVCCLANTQRAYRVAQLTPNRLRPRLLFRNCEAAACFCQICDKYADAPSAVQHVRWGRAACTHGASEA